LDENLSQYFISDKDRTEFKQILKQAGVSGPQEVEISLKLPYIPGPAAMFWCQVFKAFGIYVVFSWEIVPKLIKIPSPFLKYRNPGMS